METRICIICNNEKLLTLDNFPQGKNKRNGIEYPYWYKYCKSCNNKKSLTKNQQYKSRNRQKLADTQRNYHKINKENDSLTKKKWYQENSDSVKLRVKNNLRIRREKDPSFKLKERVSLMIRHCINKNRESVNKYLPYSLDELKQHIEKQFEPWMTWNNWGKYNVNTWNDNDQTTWKWNLDHIVPQSTFKYISMQDEDFKKCWALENLRPLSAKQNIIDGDRGWK